MLATFSHTLLCLVAAAAGLFFLRGFWRGLTLPPHKEGHGSRQTINWWWYRPRD